MVDLLCAKERLAELAAHDDDYSGITISEINTVAHGPNPHTYITVSDQLTWCRIADHGGISWDGSVDDAWLAIVQECATSPTQTPLP